MRLAAVFSSLSCLLAACSGEPSSGKPGPAEEAPTAAKTSAPPSAAPSAAAQSPARFACNAVAQKNLCIEFTGALHKEGEIVRGICDSDAWKGTFSSTGCPRDGRLGSCTIDRGSPEETKTYAYDKGAETWTAEKAKESCVVGDWREGER